MRQTFSLLTIPLLLVIVAATGAPQFAALDRAASSFFVSGGDSAAEPAPEPLSTSPAEPVSPDREPLAPAAAAASDSRPRGLLLSSLYVSFATLQALDTHSTLMAVDRGAYEANGLMAPLVEHPPALVAVKIGTTAGVLYLTEKIRKRSRVGAIVTMAAFNSVYAMVVTHNYRVAHRLGQK